MSHRLQITLSDRQYAALLTESVRSTLSMAELIRRAIDSLYRPEAALVVGGLEISVGVHRERDAAMIGRLRRKLGGRRRVDASTP